METFQRPIRESSNQGSQLIAKQPTPQIPELCANQTKILTDLNSIINELENRLRVVSRQEPCDVAGKQEDCPDVTLADTI